MEEVFKHLTDRANGLDTLAFQMRCMGQGALRSALKKLGELAEGGQRASSSKTMTVGPAGPEISQEQLASDDLEAAKTLAKLGIEAIKLSKRDLPEEDKDSSAARDLFDIASQNPWRLKKTE